MIDSDPILITGCARSGTSMVAGVINLSGAFGGDMSKGNRYNKKGMFENGTIRSNIIKPYLKRMNVSEKGQYPLPDVNNLLSYNNFRKHIESVFIKQGYKGGIWFYKGAKMCLIWPICHEAFPNSKWVIVRRRDDDIINSCLKTGFMNAFRDRKGWQWWIDQHKKRFKEMHEAGLQIMEVWPEKMLYNDYSEMKQLIEWLELEWREDAVKDFITPKLWSSYRKKHGGK